MATFRQIQAVQTVNRFRFRRSRPSHGANFVLFVISTSAVDCLERALIEMTYYVISEMLN